MSVEGVERSGSLFDSMGKRLRIVVEYAPMALLLLLLLGIVLMLSGRSSEGLWGEAYGSLRGQLAGEDRPALDRATPQTPVRRSRPPSLSPPPTVIPLSIFPALPTTSTMPCPAFYFRGTLVIKGGYASFGSFNTVVNTDPYGDGDPLTSWKLLQCERFPLPAAEADARSLSIPVDRQVNLVIVDPFTREPLFAARWHIATIEVHGRTAAINAGLDENLSQVRVNNAINSPTLAALAGNTAGTLVLSFKHKVNIASALRSGEPVYAPMNGVVRIGNCRP